MENKINRELRNLLDTVYMAGFSDGKSNLRGRNPLTGRSLILMLARGIVYKDLLGS